MSQTTPTPRFKKSRAILIGVALVAMLSVPAIYLIESTSLSVWASRTEKFIPSAPLINEFHFAGLKLPPTLPVSQAKIADDDKVIGIESGGKARAYHQRTMSGKSRHIVNDVIGGKAVTVTYCDIADCARAFGGDDSANPLSVSLAGQVDGHMLIKVGEVTYLQETGEALKKDAKLPDAPFPYANVPLTRTTWGEWKALHPDTDLYVTDEKAGDQAKPAPKP